MMRTKMKHLALFVLVLCSFGESLLAQTGRDSLQYQVRNRLDSLFSREGKFLWVQPKGEAYVLKAMRSKQLVDQLSPLIIEAVHSPKILRVDSANFAAFLAERLAVQDANYRPDSIPSKEQKLYQESRARLTPLLYRVYHSTKMDLARTTSIELKLMQGQKACHCNCSCSGCCCHGSQNMLKPQATIDSTKVENINVQESIKPEKSNTKGTQDDHQPKLAMEQRLTHISYTCFVELFRQQRMDSLLYLEKAYNDAWVELYKAKADEGRLDSLKSRYNLVSNLATLWSDVKAIDRVLAGDTIALPSDVMELLNEKDYTACYYLKPYAPGLAEEHLTARVEQYKRMPRVQRDLIEHLIALDASQTPEARQEEIKRYKATYPLEQTAPYRQLDSLRRAYSQAEEGMDYLAGIFALCRFAPKERVELALIDVLKLLDEKIEKPTEYLNPYDTSIYHRTSKKKYFAKDIFNKTFEKRYLEKTYTTTVRQVMKELVKYDYDREKFPPAYPSFTSLLVKAVLEQDGSNTEKK